MYYASSGSWALAGRLADALRTSLSSLASCHVTIGMCLQVSPDHFGEFGSRRGRLPVHVPRVVLTQRRYVYHMFSSPHAGTCTPCFRRTGPHPTSSFQLPPQPLASVSPSSAASSAFAVTIVAVSGLNPSDGRFSSFRFLFPILSPNRTSW